MLLGKENINLQLTLIDSAQSFSWKESGGAYYAALGCGPVKLWQDAGGVYGEGAEPEFLRAYLDLGRDYAEITREFSHVPCAMRAMQLYPGLRVLRQDTWEMIISFILSANNNVVRIRTLVNRISELLGKKHEMDGIELYALPDPCALASADEGALRSAGVGYRAPYLIETAKRVCTGFPIDRLRGMSYEEAHTLLTGLPGVGDKVADCVQLFGCGHACAFPVDVWVERLLKSWFHMENCSRKNMPAAARKLLGPNCGIMQQFLFHAARSGDIEL